MTEAISEGEINLDTGPSLEDSVEENENAVNLLYKANNHRVTGVLSSITAIVFSATAYLKYNSIGSEHFSSGDYFVLAGSVFVVAASTLLSIYSFYKAHKYLKKR